MKAARKRLQASMMRKKLVNNKFKTKPASGSGHFINDQIRASEVRVITDEGQNLGVLSLNEALRLAEEAGLDLVQISEGDSGTVTAKIMDFGKFLYEKKAQTKEAKKHQKIIQIKELKLRPGIEEMDFKIRINQAIQFLKDGKRVKFTLQFKGRQVTSMEPVGLKMFERIRGCLLEAGITNLLEEKESRGVPFWSKIFYLK